MSELEYNYANMLLFYSPCKIQNETLVALPLRGEMDL